jgi:glycosyl transferase family 25
MIKAFVISLPDAKARRAAINAMLLGNIDYEILDATAGKDIAGRVREFCKDDLYCARFSRDLYLNEIACSLSHKRAMERFLLSGADHGLILEDDAYIARDDFARIASATQAMRDFDFMKISGYGSPTLSGRIVTRSGNVTIIEILSVGSCTHAYIVSPAGARKLINTILPIGDPYDLFLRNVYVHKCSIYETSPWLAKLSDEAANSTIGGDRTSSPRTASFNRFFRSAVFRLRYNVMRTLFNLGKFGFSYITKSGFVKLPSAEQLSNTTATRV